MKLASTRFPASKYLLVRSSFTLDGNLITIQLKMQHGLLVTTNYLPT